MTKEELEKEVEEYLENEHCENVCTCDEIEECKKGIRIRCMSFNCKKELIVNFAEPRERQIAELEAKIEKMKADVMANIKWADKNCDNMWQKLVKMWNQWEIKEND